MALNCEVIRADWLTWNKKVILVALVDNCEWHTAFCDESEVDATADSLWAALHDHFGVMLRVPAVSSPVRRHLELVGFSEAAQAG